MVLLRSNSEKNVTVLVTDVIAEGKVIKVIKIIYKVAEVKVDVTVVKFMIIVVKAEGF